MAFVNNIRVKNEVKTSYYDEGLRRYMLGVYNFMASALGLSGITACVIAMVPSLLYAVHSGFLAYVFMFAPVVLAIVMSTRINSMKLSTLHACFWTFAASMGVSLSSLFIIYTRESIAQVFFLSAATFGAMSLYGYTTKRDLTSMGAFMYMGLIGIVIASLVNLFLHSSALLFATSVIGVVVFTALTAYDVQKVKRMYYELGSAGSEEVQKVSLMGALTLYLDFINLMVSLMHLFGKERR